MTNEALCSILPTDGSSPRFMYSVSIYIHLYEYTLIQVRYSSRSQNARIRSRP